jgi:hypothetical protein
MAAMPASSTSYSWPSPGNLIRVLAVTFAFTFALKSGALPEPGQGRKRVAVCPFSVQFRCDDRWLAEGSI